MSEFSRDRIPGEVCTPCQQFNLFRFSIADGIECDSVISCTVGGKNTHSLPENYTLRFPNSLAETSGPLDVSVDGKTHRIFDDVSAFGPLAAPEDLRFHVILEPAPAPPVPIRPEVQAIANRLSSQTDPNRQTDLILNTYQQEMSCRADGQYDENGMPMALPAGGDPYIITLEVPDGGLRDGEYNVSELTEEEAAWLRHAIYQTLSDDAIGVMTRETGAAAIGYQQMLREGNNRRFLREMAGRKLTVKCLKNGTRVLAFEGNWHKAMLWHRPHLQYGAAGMGRLQVTAMTVAVQGVGPNVSQAVRSLASRGGALGMLFVCTLDVAEWLSADGEKELDELLISLGFTLGAVVVSTIVGMAVAALAVALAAAGSVALAPVIIAGLGVGAVFLVGVGVGIAIDTSGVKNKALKAFREWSSNATINQPDFQNSDLYQGMMVAP
ncbi:hypothetical protein ADINL_2401 [Nitrincola lacisaponensis]|uniref:Uncharacterized protein n=1 Tax=Nitrincola lacisaponensis TaxID=267850 RepID=A0A063Y406_9GAMM|nr:hypothetical protein [Nitrincola lacisaponensis]KDE39272.1 hypothetical protein ADINL_2401 [Nitrincola lacisaponensis]